jgi:hypothetical protein
MKVLCTTYDYLPPNLAAGEVAFTFFERAGRASVGTIAHGWRRELKNQGFAPSPNVWDFVQFCMAVCAADFTCERATSADGWTRVIDLTVALHHPLMWIPLKEHVEEMLKVLTGDHWSVTFVAGGTSPPQGDGVATGHDCVCLLSGGLDSLIGGIDLVSDGHRPLFVSQLAHEDSERQRRYANTLGGPDSHFQWSHGITVPKQRETSTRARSLAFYAFAVLASTRVHAVPARVFVPENGFICINPPLVPGRVSSLSTKTTHPLFIAMLQQLLTDLDVNVTLELPYRFKTKGQMLKECKNQALLQRLAADTTSCGRFRTYNRRHCGRCVPCMIRKGSFLAWNPDLDSTTYVHESLADANKSSGPDDAMAAALAVLTVEQKGIDSFLGASLAFASAADRPHYRAVLQSGVAELATLLRRDEVL